MSRRTSTIVIAGVVVLAGSPFAFSATRSPIREGVRNPTANAATSETQIIARTGPDTYGTRQSNLGDGGAAIYGCRSALDIQAIGDPKRSTPCIRANNLANGKAFDFQVKLSRVAGIIQIGPSLTTPKPDSAPFITNGTGVAVGLNADRVDGLHTQRDRHPGRQRGRQGDPGRGRQRGRVSREHAARRRRLPRDVGTSGAVVCRRRRGLLRGGPPPRRARCPARRPHRRPGQPRRRGDERRRDGQLGRSARTGRRHAGVRHRHGCGRRRNPAAGQLDRIPVHHRLTGAVGAHAQLRSSAQGEIELGRSRCERP